MRTEDQQKAIKEASDKAAALLKPVEGSSEEGYIVICTTRSGGFALAYSGVSPQSLPALVSIALGVASKMAKGELGEHHGGEKENPG